jgi:superfamily II DNA helicase RecQ
MLHSMPSFCLLVLILKVGCLLLHHDASSQINYAESSVECRRVLIMHHFGELSFTAAHCRRTCDVCEANAAAGLLAPAGEKNLPACIRWCQGFCWSSSLRLEQCTTGSCTAMYRLLLCSAVCSASGCVTCGASGMQEEFCY